MGPALSPIASEFETEEQADSYDRWFRAQVEAALGEADAPGTRFVPHDQVVAEMERIIQEEERHRRHGAIR